jgi:hypothetical protein
MFALILPFFIVACYFGNAILFYVAMGYSIITVAYLDHVYGGA